MQFVDIGWLSTTGVLLNAQCVQCRVWIGLDGRGRLLEFDGLPHRCTPAQEVRSDAKTLPLHVHPLEALTDRASKRKGERARATSGSPSSSPRAGIPRKLLRIMQEV